MNSFKHGSISHARLVSMPKVNGLYPPSPSLTVVIGTLISSQNIHGNINPSNCRVAAHSFAQSPSPSSHPLTHHTARNPTDPGDQDSYNSPRGTSIGIQSSSAYTSNDHVRWCFIHKDPRPIKTFDGFKRHMREHYTIYRCRPRDSVVHTEDGPICTFCGLSNPNSRHPNVHSDPKCGGGKKYTRKGDLIKHLGKKHGVRHGSVLADQFKYTVNPRYLACGFCVFCCDSLNELVNHIEASHYRCSKNIRDWDDNKVIRGLLSQPNVNDYWRNVLAANPRLQESWVTWKPTDVKQLKYRLEMSQEPADILCQAAKASIDAGSYGMSQRGHDESIPFACFRDMGMDTSQSFQMLHHEDELSPLSHTSEPGSVSYFPQKTAPNLQSQNFAGDTDGLNGSDWDTDNEDRPSPQIASSMYGSPVSVMYHHADQPAQPWSSPSSSEGFMRRQHPTSVTSLTSARDASQIAEGKGCDLNSSNLGGYWTGTSRTDPQSRQTVATHKYSAQPRTDSYHPTLPTQQAYLPLSSTREPPPFGHLNNGYNPGRHPIPAAQSSRQETRDCHSIDMSLDSDSQQRFMQDQGRIRNQRRI